MHQIQLHFDTDAHIRIEGGWFLKDRGGNVVDRNIDPPSNRKSFQLHRLLTQPVIAASVDAPKSFTVAFASGDALTVLDDSPQYESFSLRVNGHEFHI